MGIERFLKDFCKRYEDVYFVNLELNKAGSKEVLCYECEKPILGTCLTNGTLYGHLSCEGVSTKMKSLWLHFRSGHDDLIFIEEVKSKGRKETLCFGCEEPVVGAGYKCSTSGCKFLLHQSCAQMPSQMPHPFHPNHILSFSEPIQRGQYCEGCGKDCDRCLSYECDECSINLDITCARGRTINTDECKHVFRPFFLRFTFTCDACSEEGKEIAALCNICLLLLHGRCVRFSRIIRITTHRHSLFITYSLREVREVKEGKNIFCNLCYERIKSRYGAYFCKRCDYVAHLKCAYDFFKCVCNESDDIDSEEEDKEIDGGLIEGAQEIQHFSHDHILSLSNEELKNKKSCDGCMGLIAAPFYSCSECNFFLHNRCVHLPRRKKHCLHRHPLTLVAEAPYFGGRFWCDACGRVSKSFSYNCSICNFDLDVQCLSMPEALKYEGHPHVLYLAINSAKNCIACHRRYGRRKGIFVCTECELVFCFACATLPFQVKTKCDRHPLKFAFSSEVCDEDYYCLICEKERDQKDWIYYCEICDFPAHIDCVVGRLPYIKFGSFFTDEDHEHPLTIVPKDEFSSPCDGCGESFHGMAVECDQCNLSIHDLDCVRNKSELLRKDEKEIDSRDEEAGTRASTRGWHDARKGTDSVVKELLQASEAGVSLLADDQRPSTSLNPSSSKEAVEE